MTPEGKVKKKVKEFLHRFTPGIYYFFPAANGYGVAGTPDIIGCIHGHFFGIECKANGGKLTPLQQRSLTLIEEAKGMAWVVDDTNVEHFRMEFTKWVTEIGHQ